MIIKFSLIYKEFLECEQDECICVSYSPVASVLTCIFLFMGVQEKVYLITETQKPTSPNLLCVLTVCQINV